MNNTAVAKEPKSVGVLFEEDKQEKNFSALVKLYLEGKIDYETLYKNYPNHNDSMLRKIILKVANSIT